MRCQRFRVQHEAARLQGWIDADACLLLGRAQEKSGYGRYVVDVALAHGAGG